VNAVGADQKVGFDGSAVGESRDYFVVLLFAAREIVAQVDRGGL
jgi:hypothetical protein